MHRAFKRRRWIGEEGIAIKRRGTAGFEEGPVSAEFAYLHVPDECGDLQVGHLEDLVRRPWQGPTGIARDV